MRCEQNYTVKNLINRLYMVLAQPVDTLAGHFARPETLQGFGTAVAHCHPKPSLIEQGAQPQGAQARPKLCCIGYLLLRLHG